MMETTGQCLRASIASDRGLMDKCSVFYEFFYHRATFQLVEVMSRPLITIGVGHIKLTGRNYVI